MCREGDFKLDCLEIAGLVFCASSFAGLGCSCGDLLVDFVVGEESLAGFEDLEQELDVG